MANTAKFELELADTYSALSLAHMRTFNKLNILKDPELAKQELDLANAYLHTAYAHLLKSIAYDATDPDYTQACLHKARKLQAEADEIASERLYMI